MTQPIPLDRAGSGRTGTGPPRQGAASHGDAGCEPAAEIAPGVRVLDHTGDAAIEVDAASPEELFRRAATGMLALLERGEEAGSGLAEEVEIELAAPDAAALLVRWLRELLYLAQVRGLELHEVRFEELALGGAPRLRARLACRRAGGVPRLELKAVTYHGARVERSAGGWWRARVVFDV